MANWHAKHRPRTFKTFVGHTKEVASVKADLASGDITQTWIITGNPGAGKTTLAGIIARKLLGMSVTDELDKHSDFEEMNANEDGTKETVVQLIQNTKFMPKKGNYRVILIDEVHRLSAAASSALLKATENPPKHVVYLLATNEPEKILETIKQRAKIVSLGELTQEELALALTRIAEREELEFITEKTINHIAARFVGKTRLAIITLKDLAKTAGKSGIDSKALEASIEKAVQGDYAIGGGILENLYLGQPAEACQLAGEAKDLQHVINTMLDLNNALIEQVAGIKTYQNAVRIKLWRALKAKKGVSLPDILSVQNHLFALKKSSVEDPFLDLKQVLLYTVALIAVTLKKKEKE
jgi:DNA polymerase III gamma/tau subunit